MPQAVPFIVAGAAVAGTAVAVSGQRKAERAAEKQAEAQQQQARAQRQAQQTQQRLADVRAQRARRQQVRQARVARAELEAGAVARGAAAPGVSGVRAGVADVGAQLARGLSFLDVTQQLAGETGIFNIQAAEAQTAALQAQLAGQRAQQQLGFGVSLFQAAPQIGSTAGALFPQQQSPTAPSVSARFRTPGPQG